MINRMFGLCPCQKESINDFIIEAELGSGSFGRVVRARQEDTNKVMALKIFQSSDDMIKEVTILSKLHHRYIVQMNIAIPFATRVYFCGLLRSTVPVFCMNLAKCSIEDLLVCGAFPVPVAIGLFMQLMEALLYCNTKQIYHRDIKTSNLLVSSNFHLLLADFGCATTRDKCHRICGSREFIAPEMCRGPYNASRTDIWSAGVCLFRFLTNDLPFVLMNHHDPFYRLIQKRRWNTFWELSQLESLPDNVKVILSGCLSIDPRTRSSVSILYSQEELRLHEEAVKLELTQRCLTLSLM